MTRRRGLDFHTKGPSPIKRQATPHAYAHLEEPPASNHSPARWWSPEAKELFKEEIAKGTDPDDAWSLAVQKHIEVLQRDVEENPKLKAKLLR